MHGRDPRTHVNAVPGGLTFGDHVLGVLRRGGRARRSAWPAEWWLVLVPGSVVRVQHGRPMGAALPDLIGMRVDYQPHLDLIKPPGTVEAWALTHADVLAADWVVVPAGQRRPQPDGAQLDELAAGD